MTGSWSSRVCNTGSVGSGLCAAVQPPMEDQTMYTVETCGNEVVLLKQSGSDSSEKTTGFRQSCGEQRDFLAHLVRHEGNFVRNSCFQSHTVSSVSPVLLISNETIVECSRIPCLDRKSSFHCDTLHCTEAQFVNAAPCNCIHNSVDTAYHQRLLPSKPPIHSTILPQIPPMGHFYMSLWFPLFLLASSFTVRKSSSSMLVRTMLVLLLVLSNSFPSGSLRAVHHPTALGSMDSPQTAASVTSGHDFLRPYFQARGVPAYQVVAVPSLQRDSRLFSSLGANNTIIENGSEALDGPPQRGRDSCEVSNIKCALRTGCGMALQKYMLDCSELIMGQTAECGQSCRDSLLILTSTREGRALMECECSDQYCRDTVSRTEACREQVLAARAGGAKDGAAPCRLAHLVCAADTRCAAALQYYDKFCRRMFSGRTCSPRCNNSIAILQRQEKAAALEACSCDGTEPFDCVTIKRNMAKLCFLQVDEKDREREEEETNEVDTTRVVDAEGGKAGGPGLSSGSSGASCLVVACVVWAVTVCPSLLFRGR